MIQFVLDVAVVVVTVIALVSAYHLWVLTRAYGALWFVIAMAYNFFARTAITFHHAYPGENLWNDAPLWVTGGYLFVAIAVVILLRSVRSIIPTNRRR